MHINSPYLAALLLQIFDSFIDNLSAGTHGHNNIGCFGIARIIEQVILSAREFCYFSHIAFDDVRNGVVIGIAGFAMSEINIRVFSSTTGHRIVRIKRSVAERLHGIIIH